MPGRSWLLYYHCCLFLSCIRELQRCLSRPAVLRVLRSAVSGDIYQGVSMTVEHKRMTGETFEKFLATHRDGLYELIHGEIVEKVPTEEHAKIGDCSESTGFSQSVQDEVRQGFVDGLRCGLHATYPAQDGHGSARASAPDRHSFASCDSADCPAPLRSRWRAAAYHRET